MPAVVLRHPDLPGQPIVIDVAVGEYIPNTFRDQGYEIDRETTPEEAAIELAATVEAAAEKAAEKAAEFVPEFAPLDDAGDTGDAAPSGDVKQKSKPLAAPAGGSQYANTPAAVDADATKEN